MIAKAHEHRDQLLAATFAAAVSLLVLIVLHWLDVPDIFVGIFVGGIYTRIYDDFTRNT